MPRQDEANDRFSVTSFLYGGNAAYIEELQASYEKNPASVDPEWREFFDSLADDAGDVEEKRRGRLVEGQELADPGQRRTGLGARRQLGRWSKSSSRRRSRTRPAPTARRCRDGDVLQATRDSVRAIMMIRAFRMRGHLHANLDPLGLAKPLEDYNELSPETYGFTEPTTTGRSSSTMCWGWNTRPSRRCWRS